GFAHLRTEINVTNLLGQIEDLFAISATNYDTAKRKHQRLLDQDEAIRQAQPGAKITNPTGPISKEMLLWNTRDANVQLLKNKVLQVTNLASSTDGMQKRFIAELLGLEGVAFGVYNTIHLASLDAKVDSQGRIITAIVHRDFMQTQATHSAAI